MNTKIKNPLLAVKFAAVLILLIGISNLFCTFAPWALMYYSFNIPFWESFVLYAKVVGEALNISSVNLVIYLLLVSLVISCIYIISGISLIFRKAWARSLIVYLLVIVIPLSFINSVVISLFRGFYSPNYRGVFTLICNIFFLYFFTRPQIKQLFTEGTAAQNTKDNT
jgi:hypothetical protein